MPVRIPGLAPLHARARVYLRGLRGERERWSNPKLASNQHVPAPRSPVSISAEPAAHYRAGSAVTRGKQRELSAFAKSRSWTALVLKARGGHTPAPVDASRGPQP